MRYTIKWWREELKPVGVEYRSLVSFSEIEFNIRELVDKARAQRVQVFDEDGELVAFYPKWKSLSRS